jgi:O-succinylbenzoate synthase
VLPDLDVLLDGALVVSLPMRVRFRGVTTREAVLVRGPRGWGEFGPFVEYGDGEAARWLSAAVEGAWSATPEPVRASVPVNATVPAVGSADVAAVLARFDGCTTAKVKVAEAGQSLADDVARVAEVRRLMGPGARVRVDANAAWSVDDALRAVAALARYDLEYIEQPCATLAELAELRLALARAGVDVLVAADESVRKAEDPLRVAALGSADVIVVKVAPLGGVRAALAVAEQCGLPVVVSSALDTSVGIAAGVALAAALPQLPFACGLGTVGLFERDVASAPLRPVGGSIGVAAARSLDPDQRQACAAPSERRDWWLERLARCHGVLAQRPTAGSAT